ncbi:hypothetical protein TYRP_022347 [Tyrophagus putrescentiae]|nr:hypothetical protein TYRP_022347 [Tyrophagus putrescentiae]
MEPSQLVNGANSKPTTSNLQQYLQHLSTPAKVPMIGGLQPAPPQYGENITSEGYKVVIALCSFQPSRLNQLAFDNSSLSSTGAAAADHGHLVVVPKDPKVVTALFKYKGAKDSSIGGAFSKQAPNELSFKKGEKMILLDVVEETDSSSGELSRPGWWLACKRSETDKSGYIPLNYVTVDLTSKDWYYANINRQETERLLMEPFVEQGSFLVRKRAKDLKPELNFQRLTKPMPKEGRRSTAMSTVAEAIELKDSIDQHSSVAAASSSNGRIAGNCPEVKYCIY